MHYGFKTRSTWQNVHNSVSSCLNWMYHIPNEPHLSTAAYNFKFHNIKHQRLHSFAHNWWSLGYCRYVLPFFSASVQYQKLIPRLELQLDIKEGLRNTFLYQNTIYPTWMVCNLEMFPSGSYNFMILLLFMKVK